MESDRQNVTLPAGPNIHPSILGFLTGHALNVLSVGMIFGTIYGKIITVPVGRLERCG